MDEQVGGAVTTPVAIVEVSPEMTTLLGAGRFAGAPLPPEPLSLTFCWGGATRAATLSLAPHFSLAGLGADSGAARLVLVIKAAAFARVGGMSLQAGSRRYHLPAELLSIVSALSDSPREGEALMVYRLGKSIELLCEAIRLENSARLVPLAPAGTLSVADTKRIVAARRMIDERWAERLTLEHIARACGLNRAKLTSRFREVFKCSVAEAISEKRLAEAGKMLRTTDLPVSSVGYRSGYRNNAAFSRAFSRRYGMPPSGFRSFVAAR